MNLIGLLFALLIICVVIWAARAIMAAFGIGDPIATIVYVVLVLFALAFLWQAIGGGGSLGNLRIT
jgi:membrane glycosyltransferase